MNEWINRLPKIELHCHLDGCVRPQTVAEISEREGIELSADSLDELTSWMRVPPSCTSLVEYLKRFELPLQCMQTPYALERIARELAEDAAYENVKYMEVRFAPHLHTRQGMTAAEVIASVGAGLAAAEKNADIIVRMIVICMRHHSVELNMEAVRAAAQFLSKGVVGVDLAGDEANYPPELHESVFQLADELGIPVTIHAGEAGGANNIRTAVERLHARRIGHGVRLYEDAEVAQLLRERNVPLEMCVTSNVQTKAVDSFEKHPIRLYLNRGIGVTVNTDNRTVSDTDLTKEYNLLSHRFQFKAADFKKVAVRAIEAAFVEPELKPQLLRKFQEEWEKLGI
ncbi:adenosine deaminase [Paenibacillus beijingensis]|uniref:Adenosine deaminase n=1 Tax=Paenibacillus beijingensis TaxID=1126833 RepID=A0A0D5NME2_9BACL|nr:adenosine deaminase [Paenibacillus beijingensis]AJY76103.1 hypothetical protein VN24_17975 [Paenibacillus beijingensis]